MIFSTPNSNVRFSFTLEEGKSAHTWIQLNKLIEGLKRNGYDPMVKFQAVIHDQTGKEFKTKRWMELDLTNVYG